MKNVPKLRFNEFSDEWESKRLGDFIEERSEKTEDKENYPLYSLTIENGVVPKSDRYEREFLVKKEGNFKIVQPNDFVYNPMNLRFGALAVYKGEIPVSVSGYYNVFSFKGESVSEFWSNYLKTDRMFYLYNTIATGSLEEKKRVHYSQFKELNLKMPRKEEQEKIANFLTKVDKLIEKQDEKVSNLEQYKKGMMQKIFSKEIRFKKEDGGEYPEWEYKKFKDITKKTGPRNKDNKQYTVYSISNKHGFIPQDEQFEGSRLDSLDKSAYKIVKAGDFAYNPARINVGSLGFLDSGEGIVSSLYVCFRLVAKMNNKFYMQYLSTYQFNKDVLRSVEGGVRDYLFYENFIRIIAPVPCIEEQTKIANFLSNIDLIVEKEKEKLEELKTWKKGLLQGMFV